LPAHEPSLAFDSKVRQRIAADPERGWFRWFVPQPRLAFSVALLAALTVWMARLPQNPTRSLAGAPTEEEQFQMIDHLGVLENFDMLSNSEVLSELPPQTPPEAAPHQETKRPQGDGG